MKRFPTKKPPAGSSRARSQPLDAARLNTLALAYVARFATSAGKLETYLSRKLQVSAAGWQQQEVGDDADSDPGFDIAAMRREVTDLVTRFVAAGYIDDAAFATARSGGLQRRGFGRRHIAQALGQAGIAGEVAAAALPSAQAGRQAALAFAAKRRLGPFGAAFPGHGAQDRAAREKQIATLLRAGHPLDSARILVNAPSVEAAEDWAQPDEEEDA